MNKVALSWLFLLVTLSNCYIFEPKALFESKFSHLLRINIVNGYETGETPFYVRLVNVRTKKLICGGTIIHHSLVVTAAKCFENGEYHLQKFY